MWPGPGLFIWPQLTPDRAPVPLCPYYCTETPAALINIVTPEVMDDCCWQQTGTAGKDRGLSLATGADIGQKEKFKNTRAMAPCVKEE